MHDEKLGEWMILRELPAPGKTRTWEIWSGGDLLTARLGRIKWASGWRRYALFPEPQTLFEPECLRAIAEFLDARTKEQRAGWKHGRP